MRLPTAHVVCAFLAMLQLCYTYPKYWYDNQALLADYNAALPSQPGCAEHPTMAVLTDISPHGSPQPANTAFVIADAASTLPTSTLCPGGNYTATVSFGSDSAAGRLAMLTINSSSVAFTSPAPTASCPNLVDLGGSEEEGFASSFTAAFRVPCSVAGSSLLLKVTSAGEDGFVGWGQSETTVTVAGPGSPLLEQGGACATVSASCPNLVQSSSSPSLPRPPPPPPSPPLVQPPPSPAALASNDQLPSSPPSESTAVVSNSSGCTPSNLNYTCMATRGKITIHWSVNTTSAPSNPCTPATRTELQDADVAENGTLHIAIQSAVTGYVALGFSSDPEEMYPSDIVLGYVQSSGAGYLKTFYAEEEDLDEKDVWPPSGSSSWAYDSGVLQNSSSGVTTLCFSRRLRDDRAKASPDLRAATGGAAAAGAARRRLAQDEEAVGELTLIWAVSPARGLVEHTADNVGGFFLDVSSGGAVEAEGVDERYWINVHGALMAVAWVLLLPLGTLLPAHRWLLGDMKIFGKHAWFILHMAFQWTGMVLFLAGFIAVYVKLDDGGELPGGDVGEAHEKIGIAVMAAAGAQVVLGYVRPDPSHPKRGLWNLMHHYLGRAVVLLAWANVYIGIYIYHVSEFEAKYKEWITPIAIVMGLLALLEIVLRVAAPPSSTKQQPASQQSYLVTADGGSAAPGDAPAGEQKGQAAV
ncbi:hypothetical protein Agub_g3598 [Astrephomene gubernaculifera]|uniref:Cytochrome b561 domain-containing protein n=1 Tax=Astrephomene gubernaculifera TaxID=47775 RepID=A0AAD3DMQ7_9CHLO|nr:hypothetical protein Agub_g3598 [Astrephomene gubernaculifera]